LTAPPSSSAAHLRSAPAGSRVRAWGAAVTALVLASACSIQTVEDAASTTTTPEEVAAATTTIPVEERPPGITDVTVGLSQIANYAPLELATIATSSSSNSIFVGSRTGGIYEIKRDPRRNPETGFLSYTIRPQTSAFFDLSGQVSTEEDADWGLHGFAFSTDGSRLYVSFTNHDLRTIVAELRVSNARVSPTSQRLLLEIENPDRDHNAGPLAIGADGYLHIPLGDGGGRGDPFESAQDPQRLLGKVVRIDPETGGQNPFNVPAGNLFYDPTTDENGADEIYMMGLRDPASIWYDPLTRDGWILDRGEDGVQEVNYVAWRGQPRRGGNLGWPIMNGINQYEGDDTLNNDIVPLVQYGPDNGCEIVGGATYHGNSIPGLEGAFIFGDRCTGRFTALKVEDEEVVDYGFLPVTVEANTLAAIGTDPDGEIVVVQSNGIVSQLVFQPPAEAPTG
jgi:glucose/arabinose dehydrogenase